MSFESVEISCTCRAVGRNRVVKKISLNSSTTVCPVIDVISWERLEINDRTDIH